MSRMEDGEASRRDDSIIFAHKEWASIKVDSVLIIGFVFLYYSLCCRYGKLLCLPNTQCRQADRQQLPPHVHSLLVWCGYWNYSTLYFVVRWFANSSLCRQWFDCVVIYCRVSPKNFLFSIILPRMFIWLFFISPLRLAACSGARDSIKIEVDLWSTINGKRSFFSKVLSLKIWSGVPCTSSI